jgi:2-octaprenylphenol hydroxylase
MTACQHSSFDVVISGAGMVGSTAACLFAKQGLKVGLLDSHAVADWQPDQDYPRVSAVNLASVNVFKWLEVWNSIADKRISPFNAMHVWEQHSEASIHFDAPTLGQPDLGFIIENNAITSSLIDKLRQNYNVRIMESSALSERQVHNNKLTLVTDNGETIECTLLVGADGAQSRVRELCGISADSFDYDQDAIVTSVTLEKGHQSTAWQSFLPTGPVVMLPLHDGRCSIVWSCDREFADELMDTDDERFCAALSDIFSQHLGRILDCSDRIRFPLRQRHAAHYISRYTALVGDAAHTTHPLAGLGANIGFMDVAALAEVIDAARNKNHPIANHTVLRRYERWRKGENALVLGTMKGFKMIFGQSGDAVRSIRQFGFNLADQVSPIKSSFAKYAMGLSGDLPSICQATQHSIIEKT